MAGEYRFLLGDVLYLRCKNCNPPKQKFFVVARVDPLWMFLINSERTGFAASRPYHVDATPSILSAEHPEFLDHDSFIGCDQVWFEYANEHEQLLGMLKSDGKILAGRLHANAMRAVLAALTTNKLIKRKYLNELIPIWQSAVAGG
jgi:hypothetical protein